MRKFVVAACLIGALLPSAVRAQVKIDMNRITCGEMIAMSPEDREDFAAWTSGWFAQKSGRTFIDMGYFMKNSASVMDWCSAHQSESVMAGLQRAFDKK